MLEIEIIKTNIIEGGIEIFARAWSNGVQIGFSKDGSVDIERFNIYNPPVLVADPLGDIVRESYDEVLKESTTYAYREDPEEAIIQTLEHTIRQIAKFDDSNIIAGKTGNTTSTFYPDAHPETTTVDAELHRGVSNETWATFRAGTGTVANDAAVTGYCLVQAGSSTNNWAAMRRIPTLFDISAIDSGDTIDSAIYSIYGAGLNTDGLSSAMTIELALVTPVSNTAITTGDYDIAKWTMTRQATGLAQSAWNSAAYNDLTINAAGISTIEAAQAGDGIVKFGCVNNYDLDNTAPTWAGGSVYDGVSFRLADQTGTANDPKLVVEHSAGAAPTQNSNFLMFM